MIHDGLQARRQFAIQSFDTAAADVHQFAANFFDDPETGDAQAGVYAKDTDFFTFSLLDKQLFSLSMRLCKPLAHRLYFPAHRVVSAFLSNHRRPTPSH